MILTYCAGEKDRGRTVYSVVRKELKVSAALTRRLKAVGAISVSGAPVFTDYRLSPGETVSLDLEAAEPPCDNIPEHGNLNILFENEGLIAVNKPAGMIVHPSRSKNTGTLSNFVAGYLVFGGMQNDGGTENSGACHAVNRLDRDTSGVVLFAKNSHMKSRAADALSAESAKKEYYALVCGKMPERGVIDVPIKRFEERNMLRIPSQDGQKAVTHYETISVSKAGEEYVSLVRLRLETGRTHQIRVHCLYIGYPVLGDKLYNTEESRKLSEELNITTQVLHAHKLGFTEPLSGKYIEIIAPESSGNPCQI
jgi:23S rRNA pseudouridine1911/1915/1917 synthase